MSIRKGTTLLATNSQGSVPATDAAEIIFTSALPAPVKPTDPVPLTSQNAEAALDELTERNQAVVNDLATTNNNLTDLNSVVSTIDQMVNNDMAHKHTRTLVDGTTEVIDFPAVFAPLDDTSKAGKTIPLAGQLDANGVLKFVQAAPSTYGAFPFSNAVFEGTIYAMGVEINSDVKIVSFWGNATKIAAGTSGDAYTLLTPAQYPLLERFVGTVDAWAQGIDASTWATIVAAPIQITAADGLVLKVPPTGGVNTDFTWQFMLLLDDSVTG